MEKFMRTSVVRAFLGVGISAALLLGTATAKIGKAQDKNTKAKTAVVQSHDKSKKPKVSAEEAARRARLKKIGSAAPKDSPKTNGKQLKQERHPQPAKAAKSKANVNNNQVASNADGGSVAERRARIHNMRVPE